MKRNLRDIDIGVNVVNSHGMHVHSVGSTVEAWPNLASLFWHMGCSKHLIFEAFVLGIAVTSGRASTTGFPFVHMIA